MLAKNWGEPMGAPAIFEKQIESESTLESLIQVNIQTPRMRGTSMKFLSYGFSFVDSAEERPIS
ncbi:MAG: hypothetical protein P8X74_13500 [Reinekea sp.]